MDRYTVCLPDTYVVRIAELVEAKLYPNRSEFIRCAIRDLLREENKQMWEDPFSNPEKIKVITLVDPAKQKQYRIVERLD